MTTREVGSDGGQSDRGSRSDGDRRDEGRSGDQGDSDRPGSTGDDPSGSGGRDEDPAGGDVAAVRDRLATLPIEECLAYARERDYAGWDFCDGMSSRLLRALPVDARPVNLAVQEFVKRCPVNVRPLLLVERRRNYQGAALFAMANLAMSRLSTAGVPTTVDHRGEAQRLLDWLVDRGAEGHAGYGVGHPHEVQALHGLAPANVPGSVVTSYAVKALLRGADLNGRYAAVARTAADFVVEDLDYRQTDDGARITYNQNHGGDYYTLNAGALAARLFVDLYDQFGDREYCRRARELLDHVAARQTDRGGWHYRDPPAASHLSMDTHHNGFVVECFQRYAVATGEDRYDEVLAAALSFFEEVLFEVDGAPRFDESSAYPRDVHASAQGVLVGTYAGDLEFARRVLDWTVEHLHAGGGRFQFRRHRLYTNRNVLMRWCQAWMAFAATEYLRAVYGERPIASV